MTICRYGEECAGVGTRWISGARSIDRYMRAGIGLRSYLQQRYSCTATASSEDLTRPYTRVDIKASRESEDPDELNDNATQMRKRRELSFHLLNI